MRVNLATRPASGERILLDGAKLQRRGVNVTRGYDAQGNIGPRSTVANMTAPDVVRQVHGDYLAQGTTSSRPTPSTGAAAAWRWPDD